MNSVDFLGHVINARGIHSSQDKVKYIEKTPNPTNATQLKSYLGLLNYYGKFIPMISANLKCLYDLYKAESVFEWSKECERVFQKSKVLLTSNNVLMHYNPKLPIIVTYDSSGCGVGAVLSHLVNGEERPVLFQSSTLSNAKRNIQV